MFQILSLSPTQRSADEQSYSIRSRRRSARRTRAEREREEARRGAMKARKETGRRAEREVETRTNEFVYDRRYKL